MLPDKVTNTNIGIGLGVVLMAAGKALAQLSASDAALGLAAVLVGQGLFIWGCMNYAEGKGHSKWLGLLGLLSLFGLLALAALRDHYRETKPKSHAVSFKPATSSPSPPYFEPAPPKLDLESHCYEMALNLKHHTDEKIIAALLHQGIDQPKARQIVGRVRLHSE